jgi:N-acetylglucosaminyldiphosphoundecaprenol N-acetyl-beta-D-mannosaminyltransferase
MGNEQYKKGPGDDKHGSPLLRYHRLGRWRLRLRRSVRVFLLILMVRIPGTLKRVFDLVLALFLILLFLPLLIIIYPGLKLYGHGIREQEKLGKWNATFELLEFDIPESGIGRMLRYLLLHRLPTLFNILKGDISFVGPRIIAAEEFRQGGPEKFETGNIRPGLLTLWHIRRQANIDFEDAFRIDLEYLQHRTLLGDFGIALRMIPAALYGSGSASAPEQIEIMGVRINNLTMVDTVDRLLMFVTEKTSHQICFVNTDCFNIADKDPEYRSILDGAALVLADGIGVKLAAKILNREIKQNVNGTDLFPRLCEGADREKARIYLLGAPPGIAEQVAAWIKDRFPTLVVAGWHDGYYDKVEEGLIIDEIHASRTDILLVAFGAPRQEKWIHQNLERTGASVAMGVGGLFDFYSGRIPRAPVWVREIGMEWFYRFLQEPSRMWKRYFVGNTVFLWRIIRERISRNRHQEV